MAGKHKEHEKLVHPSLKGVKDGLDLKSKLGKRFIKEEKREKMGKGY